MKRGMAYGPLSRVAIYSPFTLPLLIGRAVRAITLADILASTFWLIIYSEAWKPLATVVIRTEAIVVSRRNQHADSAGTGVVRSRQSFR